MTSLVCFSRCLLCVFAAMLSIYCVEPLRASERIVVVPQEDPNVVLSNPDMGWVLYENFVLDSRHNGSGTLSVLPDANFDGCDGVAILFAWSDVETEDGRFDWSRVDLACEHWLKRGKTLHLRISTEPLFGWSLLKPPAGLGIPEWLLKQIPEAQKVRRLEGAQFGWHVDARNALYQEKLRRFLAAANEHFSGKYTPALVDLRGFGRWGEWHSGFPYASQEDKRAALQAVLNIWSDAFPQRMLALSYSHDPDGPRNLYEGPTNRLDESATRYYSEYLRFSAIDLALQKPNITLRRDGAGGAVYSNQRKLSEHFYKDLRRAPQMSEFVGGYAQTREGGAPYVIWTLEDALSLHPNYVGLLGYGGKDAQAFMLERPDLIAHGLRTMGYRLVPLKAAYPAAVRPNERFVLELEWTNRAVGRALRDYQLLIRFTDEKGRLLAQSNAGVLPTSQWLHGGKHPVRVELTAPESAERKTVRMLLGLQDPATQKNIRLPLVHRTPEEFCRLGEITLESGK